MNFKVIFAAAFLSGSSPALAETTEAFDAAAAFGSRQNVSGLRLSPDGKSVAYVSPVKGQGSAVYALALAKGSRPKVALASDGSATRITDCNWVSNGRLVCVIYGIAREPTLLGFTRTVAIDTDGSNPKLLSTFRNAYSRGWYLGGGEVVDWLPDEDGAVLMSRVTLPDDHIDSHIGSDDEGLRVDWLDTRTLAARTIERPNRDAVEYITDGRGTVRIMVVRIMISGSRQFSGSVRYFYRRKSEKKWEPLGTYDYLTRSGFEPIAVDPDADLAYGLKKKDGRLALYTISLDGSLRETLAYSREDVDVDNVIRVGRRGRVVGASYATDRRSAFFLDPAMGKLTASLSSALPTHPPLRIVDSSVDESKLLIFSSSDNDPGVYYIFDRNNRQLDTFLVVREALEDTKLANVLPINYPAADGTAIPGYLTLPPGKENAKGLPAIVMPHGGPAARDEWGFDWLAQFYAARGFAVLQPNFRGSAGYGDAWFEKNGFRSWPIAIGDVLDAGRWLVSQGTADPSKLAIVGWSYGGYAALQSAVVDSTVFKAVVAIAPVTDLTELKAEHQRRADWSITEDFIGSGPHVREGSPAQNATKIKVPVLLFHGTTDLNVAYAQSQLMDERLAAAGVKHELVTFEGLDHHLEDSGARIGLLRKSDEFLRRALGL